MVLLLKSIMYILFKNFRRPVSLDIFYGLWLSCEAGLSLARLRRRAKSQHRDFLENKFGF